MVWFGTIQGLKVYAGTCVSLMYLDGLHFIVNNGNNKEVQVNKVSAFSENNEIVQLMGKLLVFQDFSCLEI